jgi:hypothetical protein
MLPAILARVHKPESSSLMDEIAEAINANPRLRSAQRRCFTISRITASLRSGSRASGFGEERPIASNESAAGMEANRRVEFLLTEQDLPKRTYEMNPATRRGELLDDRSSQQQ